MYARSVQWVIFAPKLGSMALLEKYLAPQVTFAIPPAQRRPLPVPLDHIMGWWAHPMQAPAWRVLLLVPFVSLQVEQLQHLVFQAATAQLLRLLLYSAPRDHTMKNRDPSTQALVCLAHLAHIVHKGANH